MGLLDRLLGRLTGRTGGTAWPGSGPGTAPASYRPGEAPSGQPSYGPPGATPPPPRRGGPQDADAQAVARYQYLLRTAPPDQIERAHAQAFESLTQAQRQQVLQQLAAADPSERPVDDSPAALARSATRQEMRAPGSLQRTFGGAGMGRMGGGMAGMGLGGVLLASVAGAVMGSAIANEMFDNDGFMDWDREGQPDEQGFADSGSEGDYANEGGDYAGGDVGGGDFGGGDFGGGDFGGGDFGGFGGDF